MSVTIQLAGGGPAYLAAWSGDSKSAPVAADKVLIYDSAAQDYKETTIGNLLGGLDVLLYKGVIDCSGSPNYPAADAGHEYRISVGGKIGGASGPIVQAGDIVICNTDGSAAGTQAAVGANWNIIQLNIQRPIEGPASSTTFGVSVFSDSTATSVESRGVTIDNTDSVTVPGDVHVNGVVNVEAVQGASTTGGSSLELKDASGNLGICIENGGEVGIGTESPDELLHVSTTTAAAGAHIGYAFVGVWKGGSSAAVFANDAVKDTQTSHSLLSTTAGGTRVNAATGQVIGFQIGGTGYANLLSTGDFQIKGTGNDNLFFTDYSDAKIGIGTSSLAARLHVDQFSNTGAQPVLALDQADVSEEFIRFIGTAANGVLTQSIVNDDDVTTATLQGWAKVYVQDDGNQITDQAYFMPLFTIV